MNEIKCPKCGKSHYVEGMSTSTLMYFPPIYKDGVNINPDRNTIKTEYTCLECDCVWQVAFNGISESVYILKE